MADAADSKSAVRKGVSVQVRPSALALRIDMSRTKPRLHEPASLASLLTQTRVTAGQAGHVAVDGDTWTRLVGVRIAERAQPGPAHAGILTVHVASAVWAQELS